MTNMFGSSSISRHSDADGAKAMFACAYGLFLFVFAIIMHFVIMYKGWGLSVKSWGWCIFLWIVSGIVTSIKDSIVKFIKSQ